MSVAVHCGQHSVGVFGSSLQIYILDPALNNTVIYQRFKSSNQRPNQSWTEPLPQLQHRDGLGMVRASELTYGQLHGLPLVFRGDFRPARRCFTQHAFWALYWARRKGWPVPDVKIDVDHFGWMSPRVEARLRNTALWLAMRQEAAAADAAAADNDESGYGDEAAAGESVGSEEAQA